MTDNINYILQLISHYNDKIISELKHDTVSKILIGKKELCVVKAKDKVHIAIWNKDGSVYVDVQFKGKVLDEPIKQTIYWYINHLVYIWKGL